MRDAVMHQLIHHLPIDTQHYQPAVVYLNGEYWGILNFRDRHDEHYLHAHHGIDPKHVAILESNARLRIGTDDARMDYLEMVAAIGNGILDSWEAVDDRMDLSQYLDYLITQMYSNNTDWPHNNIRYWRYTGSSHGPLGARNDGRWRWLVFDIDFSFGLIHRGTGKHTNMIEHLLVENLRHPDRGMPWWAHDLPLGIVAIDEARAELIQRTATHLSTTFHPVRVTDVIQFSAQQIEAEIPNHYRRWGRPSPDGWQNHVNIMIDYAKDRPDIFRQHVVDFFSEADGVAQLTVAGLPGYSDVKLHTVPLHSQTPGVEVVGGVWSGLMFTGSAPVVLTSGDVDLRGTVLSGGHQVVEQTRDRLAFTMSGDVSVVLP